MSAAATSGRRKTLINFVPQPGPQFAFIRCPVSTVFYGGARGGGKSVGALGHFAAKAQKAYEDTGRKRVFTGIIIRKTIPELRQLIETAKDIYFGCAVFHKQDTRFEFYEDGPYGGAVLRFRYLEHDSDADRYQGAEFQWLCIEEAGNFASPIPLDKLRATLRSSYGTKTYAIYTGNPGGRGHAWLKSRFIDPAPPNTPFKSRHVFGGKTFETDCVFIPARLEDNKILMQKDPDYAARIAAAAGNDENLYKAWMEGSWDITAGGMFDDIWSHDKHVLPPFPLPPDWPVYRAYDWGSASPFSIGWWARTTDSAARMADGSIRHFPPGTIIRIAEWYGSTGSPNAGLTLREGEIIDGVLQREDAMRADGVFRGRVLDGPADHNIFQKTDGSSLSEQWRAKGIHWQPADKAPGSRRNRWLQLRDRLSASRESPMERPGLFVFDRCREFVRLFPAAPRDQRNPEDIDPNYEDHIPDEAGYFCLFTPVNIRIATLHGL